MAIGFQKGSARREQQTKEGKEVDSLENVSEEKQKPKKSLDPKILCVAVAGCVCLGVVLFTASKGKEEEEPIKFADGETEQSSTEEGGADTEGGYAESGQTGANGEYPEGNTGNGIYDEEGNVIDPNGITPGITDYQYSNNNVTSATVYSDSDFIKDLNGLDVAAIYHEASIENVTEYVSYETRRAITDDGMELYWLEANYRGKRYRIQVPFYYFKDLGTEGICKVEMEVVTTTEGGKLITYMRVVDDNYTIEEW